ncbi:MAG TPA: amidohydrolase family protein [Vicinamibacterales bacterium]|nr:amidohydrolase family protein [Vicinamibacterales bacterium]
MNFPINRRQFIGSLAALPFAMKTVETALEAQRVAPEEAARLRAASMSPFPVIDTHIHIFDKSRPGGMGYPRDMPGGGEPPQGHIALPNRYKLVAEPFGIVGAVIVEAATTLPDNFWLLDVAKGNPNIVGVVGRLDPNDPDFPKSLQKLAQNKMFLGVREGGLRDGVSKPEYMSNIKRLADADCSLDIDTPAYALAGPGTLLKILDKVPNLRVVLDHIPGMTYRVKDYADQQARARFVADLKELGGRPNVYAKLSEVVRVVNGTVSSELNTYKDWLDQMWDVFGEDRIMFGSDWPQSESVEYNSYPNVIGVARAYVKTKGPAAMEKVFWKNSSKPYRWVQREPAQKKS